ncbi:LOW QUALITY PROTEIN: receptor-like kinase TMK4, partial [Arabidopsis lyrata subsp. lyrata]|uniref:LOW QUALITY PROTEIN: receptor-like kinase TMK4 n=1 Tax=Arabidopsis lyrata subsp. lyrata TaxID=81972 RepID=UPI000A29ABCD
MMKLILFTVFAILAVVSVSEDDDGAAMLAVSRAFQPHPPRWSTRSSFAYCKWKGVECNHINHRVISINISGLLLGGVISSAISSLPELVEVNLQNNQLTGEIPRLPKHIKVVYKLGNQLLRHMSRDNGVTTGIVIASTVGGGLILITFSILVCAYQLKKSTLENVENGRSRTEEVQRALITGHDRDENHYPIENLRRATNDFSDENVLGRGGSGVVYRGVQRDGTTIAVKKMEFGVLDERAMSEFNNEISVFTSLRHKHLVPLLGFCIDGNEKLLVYEYMPLGTLAHHLFEWSNRGYNPLTWTQRIAIALDIARGIQYLHGLARRNYIHRDLKPSNVLIGDGMRAKISDFGCMKLLPEGVDSVETATVVGTFGYIDPDYLIICIKGHKKGGCLCIRGDTNGVDHRKKANDETLSDDEQNVVRWLRPKIKDTTFLNLIDGTIATDEETIESIKKIAKLAEYCTSQEVESRPDMFQTVNWLVPLVE